MKRTILDRARDFLAGREPPPFYWDLAEALMREHDRLSDSVLEAKEAEIEALRAEVARLRAENERLCRFARVVRFWDDACEGKIAVRTDGARANLIRHLREISDLLDDDKGEPND